MIDPFEKVRKTKLAQLCHLPFPPYYELDKMFKKLYENKFEDLFNQTTSIWKKIPKS